MDYKNKVFLVTGAGNGMGREVALYLLARNAKVIGIALNMNRLEETAKLAGEKGENFFKYTVDVVDKNLVEQMCQEVMEKHKKIDGVFNIAGIIQPFVKLNELAYENIERVMNVNFYGTVNIIKSFLPHLLKNETKSYLVNVSSMGGFLPVPGQCVYGASKAGVKLLTESLYAELKGTNVQVNLVMPGAVATNIMQNSGVKMTETNAPSNKKQTILSPQKAGQMIMKGVEKNKLFILVGKDSKFMYFLYKLFPKYAINLVAKNMSFLLKK